MPSESADDDVYTDDERPRSSTPVAEQFGIMLLCLTVVITFIVLACCVAKKKCGALACCWHERLVQIAEKVERKDAARERAERARARRAAAETAESPLRKGLWARLWGDQAEAVETEAGVLKRQSFLVVWKALACKGRSGGLATFFGFPLCAWFLIWLLYATFNDKNSSGALEQYLGALSLVFVLQNPAAALAADKQLKLRESFRAMGLRDAAYWLGPLVVDGLVLSFTLGVLLTALVVPCGLLHNAGLGNNEAAGFGQARGPRGLDAQRGTRHSTRGEGGCTRRARPRRASRNYSRSCPSFASSSRLRRRWWPSRAPCRPSAARRPRRRS